MAETESYTDTEYDNLDPMPHEICVVSNFNYKCPITEKLIGIQVKDVEITITDFKLIYKDNKEIEPFS